MILDGGGLGGREEEIIRVRGVSKGSDCIAGVGISSHKNIATLQNIIRDN